MSLPNLSQCFSKNNTIAVRGISALCIVLYHIIISLHISPVFNFTGALVVAVFLIVSGYGVNESYKVNGLDGYWFKKFDKVIIPSALFICGYNLIYNKDVNSMVDELLDRVPTFWFIFHIIKCYAVYYIAMLCFKGKWSLVFMVVFAVACLFYNNSAANLEPKQSFSFLTGVIVSRYKESLFNISPKKLAGFAVVCAVVGAIFYVVKLLPAVQSIKSSVWFNLFLMPMRLFGGIALLYFFTLIGVGNSVALQKIGKYSLEIYLAHVPYRWLACSLGGLLHFFGLSAISLALLLTYRFVADYLLNRVKIKS